MHTLADLGRGLFSFIWTILLLALLFAAVIPAGAWGAVFAAMLYGNWPGAALLAVAAAVTTAVWFGLVSAFAWASDRIL